MSTLANLSAHSGKQHAYIVGTFVLLNVLCILTAWFQAIIFEIQCNVFVCEQSNNWHDSQIIHTKAIGPTNAQRCCSPLVSTEPFEVTLFWLEIRVYRRVCMSEYNQRRQSNVECYWRVVNGLSGESLISSCLGWTTSRRQVA